MEHWIVRKNTHYITLYTSTLIVRKNYSDGTQEKNTHYNYKHINCKKQITVWIVGQNTHYNYKHINCKNKITEMDQWLR